MFIDNDPTKGIPYTPPTPAGLVALHLLSMSYQAVWTEEAVESMSWIPEDFDPKKVRGTKIAAGEYRKAWRVLAELHEELVWRHKMEDLTEDPQIVHEAKQRAQITVDQHRRRNGLPT